MVPRRDIWFSVAILAVIGLVVLRSSPPTSPSMPAHTVATPQAYSAPARHYLFDVDRHSPQEIHAMLERAQHIQRETAPEERDRTAFTMVIHGPDVEIFADDTRPQNRAVVELAARLEHEHWIDFKVCERSLTSREIGAEQFPEFIEIVPYGPDETERLKALGAVQL